MTKAAAPWTGGHDLRRRGQPQRAAEGGVYEPMRVHQGIEEGSVVITLGTAEPETSRRGRRVTRPLGGPQTDAPVVPPANP